MSKQHNMRNENTAVRVFIYARAASSENIEENLSLQLQELIDYCHKRGYIKSKVFVDRGVSGRTPLTSRTAAKEMLEELPKYAVDAIIVSDASRISRYPVDYFAFRKEMRNEGVSVIVVNQSFSKLTVSKSEIKTAFKNCNDKQTGCIGYVRGDFGDGEQFYSSFFDTNKELKTPDFKGELDDLIDYFHEHGDNPLLRSRADMYKNMPSDRQFVIKENGSENYCFKVITGEHTYYFACNPREGDYNFYILCYNTEILNSDDAEDCRASFFARFPMERLVGRRYETLEALKKDIEEMTGKKVGAIWESSSERPKGTDYMIDYEFELFDIYTLFYLRDSANRYYITEV